MKKNVFTITVTENRDIAPETKHLAFVKEDGEPLSYIPGQFIRIHFDARGTSFNRSYSIATMPGEHDFIEFAAAYVDGGPASEMLFQLKAGDRLEASGPFGRLILPAEDPKRYILIATGTGVTPYRAMLPELAKRMQNSDLKVDLLFGTRGPDYLLYGEDFLNFAEQHDNFRFFACYGSHSPEELKAFERGCRVQHTFDEIEPNPETDIVFLCGNPNMIDEAFEKLQTLEFPSNQVKREKYISSK